MPRSKAVAYHQNVSDQAVGDFCVVNLLCASAFINRIAHVRVPGHCGVHFVLGKERGRLNAIFGMNGFAEDLIAFGGAQSGGFQAVPQQKVRRSVGSKGDRLTGQAFNTIDALLHDHAIGAARPINHQESM